MADPYDFHGSQETNRGCPYSCTFCDWGSNVLAKVKIVPGRPPNGRVRMVRRTQDRPPLQLRRQLRHLPPGRGPDEGDGRCQDERTGFPNKFRAAYAKNSNERVFTIARMLHAAGMNKGVTLSFQSMNDETLKLIKRHNIKTRQLPGPGGRYRAEGIATYSEFIIGLPGETYHTFADGLDTLIRPASTTRSRFTRARCCRTRR
jgi:putative methyltransferase